MLVATGHMQPNTRQAVNERETNKKHHKMFTHTLLEDSILCVYRCVQKIISVEFFTSSPATIIGIKIKLKITVLNTCLLT